MVCGFSLLNLPAAVANHTVWMPSGKYYRDETRFWGYLNSRSATFLQVGGWQRDATMLDSHLATLKFAKGALAGAQNQNSWTLQT